MGEQVDEITISLESVPSVIGDWTVDSELTPYIKVRKYQDIHKAFLEINVQPYAKTQHIGEKCRELNTLFQEQATGSNILLLH